MKNLLAVLVPDEAPLCVDLGGFRYRCERAWTFTILFEDRPPLTTTIPVGFVCDLFSVPPVIQWFIPKAQASNIAAWVHDWLFATVGLRPTAADPSPINLSGANWCLEYVAKHTKIPWITRRLIMRGLSIGSWKPWNELKRAGHSLATPKMR